MDANDASRIEIKTGGTVTGASTILVAASPAQAITKTEGAPRVVTK